MHGISVPALKAAGLFSPMLREVAELSYMFTRPYLMDSRHTQDVLDLAPTPWLQVCRRTVDGNPVPART